MGPAPSEASGESRGEASPVRLLEWTPPAQPAVLGPRGGERSERRTARFRRRSGRGLGGSRAPWFKAPPRRCGCLSRWRVPGAGEPRAPDACRGEDIAPPRRMDGCQGHTCSVSCPASWGGLAPTRSAHHPRSRRGPGPAPRARHYEGRFASALSPREKGREDANAFRNVAVCLSVRLSPTSDLRGLPTIAHRREGKRRHANLQVTPRGTPLSLTPSSAGPPHPR